MSTIEEAPGLALWQVTLILEQRGDSTLADIIRRAAAAFGEQQNLLAPRGTQFTIDHDGFTGQLIGEYVTLEGKTGAVLQLNGTRVVHVYGTKWLKDDEFSGAFDAQS